MIRWALVFLCCALPLAVGCARETPKPVQTVPPRGASAVPSDIRAAADATLGSGSEVLAFGDLARNGHRQALMINRLTGRGDENTTGIPLRRAAIVEENGANWAVVMRCDEYLKNPKGFLGRSPLAPVTGWRLAIKRDSGGAMQELYFTPLTDTGAGGGAAIGVRWNPAVNRYESLDVNDKQFLGEAYLLEMPTSKIIK